jgi:hypothetical protein
VQADDDRVGAAELLFIYFVGPLAAAAVDVERVNGEFLLDTAAMQGQRRDEEDPDASGEARASDDKADDPAD